MSIETHRQALEEIDVLEDAICSRYIRNLDISAPEAALITNPPIPSKKRSRRETILEEQEIQFFAKKFLRLAESINRDKREGVIAVETAQIKDPQFTFTEFDSRLANLKEHFKLYGASRDNIAAEPIYDTYKLFSSAKADQLKISEGKKLAKRIALLSSASVGEIDPETLFTANERFGSFLDLYPIYNLYRSLNPTSEKSYIQFLSTFDALDYTTSKEYISTLASYLEGFIQRSRPFVNLELLKSNMRKTEDTERDPEGRVFCSPCNKWFTKASVYEGHLTGRKHKKNAEKLGKSGVPKENHIENLVDDNTKVQYYTQYLKSVIKNTITETERRSALSERERWLEDETLQEELTEFTSLEWSEDSDESEQEEEYDGLDFKNLPVGADGQPMPFWLYKLQGYHKSYNCEICGNTTYKGRMVFTKHFLGSKHQQGLKLLGIHERDLQLFKNIVLINEASELWKRLNRTNRIKEGERENAVEVEDAEGNVMSEKDYLDLKKQGLL